MDPEPAQLDLFALSVDSDISVVTVDSNLADDQYISVS